MHSYLGFLLRVSGHLEEFEAIFSVGLGKVAFSKHQPQVGDVVSGLGVESPPWEPADIYKVSEFKIGERGPDIESAAPTWVGSLPDLPTYRARGYRRLSPQTYAARCDSCKWACRMSVEIIMDRWDATVKRHRYETFCYGPRSCALYRAGRLRTVPWKGGPAWEEPEWLDDEATSHRGPDE